MQAANDAMGEVGGVGALRALDLAAIVLARVRTVKWAALGLDGRSPPDGELAELVVRVMTEKEIAAMRRDQEAVDPHRIELDPDAANGPAGQDDVVAEGDDQPPMADDAGRPLAGPPITGRPITCQPHHLADASRLRPVTQRGAFVNEAGRVGGHDG